MDGQEVVGRLNAATVFCYGFGGPDGCGSGSDFGRSFSAWPKFRVIVKYTARDPL